MPIAPEISTKDGNLVIQKTPTLEVYHGSKSIVQFITEHFERMNESTCRQWVTSISELNYFESEGIFLKCQVTIIFHVGRAVVLLNECLQISIFKLKEIDPTDCSNILKLIGVILPSATSEVIPNNVLLLTNKYRLRLECHRRESVSWVKHNSNNKISALLDANLQNYEKDRLFTFKNTVIVSKALSYFENMMSFVTLMNPRNVSEIVSFGEYVITYVEAEKRNLESDLRNNSLSLYSKKKKATILRQQAIETAFNNPTAMRQKWETTIALVREYSMVSPISFESGLSDEVLVTAVRNARIGFSNEASAAYHVLKHSTEPLSAYVERANEIVRRATRWHVRLSQDGDARLLHFESPLGSANLFEQEGNVILCTFLPKLSSV